MRPATPPHRYGGRAWAGRSVGLLGGSFNPAHDGHLHASLLALRTLGLDQVWWLVSPQNPLKPVKGMAPFAQRLAQCRVLVRHPRIVVSDIETELGTRYTVDILAELKKRYPRTRFVWIMGADNLIQIRRWKNWRKIFATVPVAIYDRPPYSLKAKASFAARRYARWRRQGAEARTLGQAKSPAWAFFHTKLKAISSTAIRRMQAEGPSHIDHR
jgi:nicotinate-nucleotide adenylyltransferase